jgi:hypothetical protein
MYFVSQEEQFKILLKLSLIALYILVAYDLIIIAFGYYAVQLNAVGNSQASTLIRNIMFLIAIAELIATYFVRRSMLAQAKDRHRGTAAQPGIVPYGELLKITIVVATMSSAISTYGLVLLFLGERFEMLLLFVILSLIGYQFFRLRPGDFKADAGP